MLNKGFVFIVLALLLAAPIGLLAQENQEEQAITANEEVQVTATRIPEAVEPEPAAITIVTGEELRATGAYDLEDALSLVSGVAIAPGGDGGPASSVPEFWGLREFDAFLLVVDGVPWGGAFVPALSTLNLNDVERIEILRGAAPVMYGATSFVGVIHVIHRSASAPGRDINASVGNYSTGNVAGRFALPSSETWHNSVSGDYEAKGYKDDRTNYDRGHFLYRGEHLSGDNRLHFDADLTFLRQDPASPHPREGTTLSPAVPLDANHNPLDSQQDEDRYHFVGGYDTKLGASSFSLLGSITHATRDIIKGFLSDISNEADPNTAGYRQTQDETDVYLDGHFASSPSEKLNYIVGADYIHGSGNMKAENFDYHVNLDGTGAPNSHDNIVQERPQLDDERNFFGLYAQADLHPSTRFLIQAGIRFNSTHEKRDGEVLPGDPGGAVQEPEEAGSDSLSTNRMSGTVGASYLAWGNNNEGLWIFGDYRNSFKPAVIDFGPEAEGDILDPETAQSYEAGLKGRLFERRFDWQASFFLMDFKNLVTSVLGEDGLPELINAGEERFKGFEFEGEGEIQGGFRWQFNYAFHSAKFTDFVRLFDDVPTQLAGRRLEMTPRHLLSGGLIYNPPKGIVGSVIVSYTGDRFLNMRNTALAEAYTTVSFGAGYKFHSNTIRFDLENATDRRDPVSESELGDAQYYRLPARAFRVNWYTNF